MINKLIIILFFLIVAFSGKPISYAESQFDFYLPMIIKHPSFSSHDVSIIYDHGEHSQQFGDTYYLVWGDIWAINADTQDIEIEIRIFSGDELINTQTTQPSKDILCAWHQNNHFAEWLSSFGKRITRYEIHVTSYTVIVGGAPECSS
jgi:hypothetical protein